MPYVNPLDDDLKLTIIDLQQVVPFLKMTFLLAFEQYVVLMVAEKS